MHPRLAGRAAALTALGITDKLAASRIDKALQAGQLAFKDVMPKIKAPVGAEETQQWKQLYRNVTQAPAPRPREAVARTRALNAAKYEQALKNTGVPGVSVVDAPGPSAYIGVPFEQHTLGVVQAYVPRDGVTLLHQGAYEGAYTKRPRRGWPDFDNKLTPHGGTEIPEANLRVPRNEHSYPTLRHAVTQHEIGEARTLAGAPQTTLAPHASHLGVEPVLRENLALQGDPTAQRLFAKLRIGHSDDAHVQRLIRQVGGRADAPVALDSRRARALQRRLDAQPSKLSPLARQGRFTAALYTPELVAAQKTVPPEIANLAAKYKEVGEQGLSKTDALLLTQYLSGAP